MKKIILKKLDDYVPRNRIGYKINYEYDLNPAQFEAVMHQEGAALVIAGAGTGKTRTLIYRVARLVEDQIPPESILLLTFTRKSSVEMLRRAAIMLDGRCEQVSGGTFHSFALRVLRQWAKLINYDPAFNVLDQGDIEDTINLLRSHNKFDKTKKRFPRKDTLARIFNLSINRSAPVEDIVLKDFPHFFDEIDGIIKLFAEYNAYKRRYNLMDYDDILLNLKLLCQLNPQVQRALNEKYRFLMVDEYQDTNRLQHEIVLQLAGEHRNVMAVGDDAQSIYSFRGAEFQNIMTFPDSFDDCKIYKIEENYRSTQPILNLTNFIIAGATYKYSKELFSIKTEGEAPKIITARDEKQQSEFIVQQVLELREEGIDIDDIAVLFRSGFLSFDLEIELNRANISYKKFGGLKFIETAHIKDLLAYFKILFNDHDAVAWHRALLLVDGVGNRTAAKIIELIDSGKLSIGSGGIDFNYLPKGKSGMNGLFTLFNELGDGRMPLGEKASRIIDYYKPILKQRYDDWQKRSKDIEMFLTIAERYKSMNDFLNDMAVEPPIESVSDVEAESKEDEFLTLSTIHSAKGLEWRAVFIIWALDGRFPSSKAADTLESLEEERRLFYVACTRAKEKLYITYPVNIFDKFEGTVLSKPTRFLDGVPESIAERYMLADWDYQEN